MGPQMQQKLDRSLRVVADSSSIAVVIRCIWFMLHVVSFICLPTIRHKYAICVENTMDFSLLILIA